MTAQIRLWNSDLIAIVDDESVALVGVDGWRLSHESDTQTYAKRGKERMHRLVIGAQPGQIVDHIDGNGLNNVRSNLRFCTAKQNCINRRRSINQQAGRYKGVYFERDRDGYRAAIYTGSVNEKGRTKKVYLGTFRDAVSAARAYDAAALRYFGEFAALNFEDGK